MKKFIYLLLFFFVLNCKSNNDIESILKEKDIHNKYSDSYENNRYINSALNMEIDFTPLWKIIVNYENLDEYQKKLFDYFDSSIGEVIFVGYNESKKIGVRCIVENLGYSNLEYKNLIKENNAIEFKTYKVNFTKEEEIILPNISGINMVYSVEINPHNVFIYNTLLFKKESFNIRLDFWCKDKKYQEAENEIKEIFNSIDFFVFQKKEEKKDSNVKIEFKDSK